MSTIIKPQDFRQGVNPVGSGKPGARNFQQSFARDRNYFVSGKILSNFSYAAGWGVPLFGGLFALQGFEFGISGANYNRGQAGPEYGSVQEDYAPSANPIVTGLGPVTTSVLTYGTYSYADDLASTNTGLYFKSGASCTLQYTDLIIPGQYQISFSGGGNGASLASGGIQIYAGGNLLFDYSVGLAGPPAVTFSSKVPFSIKAVMSGMSGDFSGFKWYTGHIDQYGFFQKDSGPSSGLPGGVWEVPIPPFGTVGPSGVAWGSQDNKATVTLFDQSGNPFTWTYDQISGPGFGVPAIPGFNWNLNGTRIGNA